MCCFVLIEPADRLSRERFHPGASLMSEGWLDHYIRQTGLPTKRIAMFGKR
jgi:hypothetical protein